MYIYQQKDWANFTWNNEEIVHLLSSTRNLQGRLIGKMRTLDFDLKNEAFLETLMLDVLKYSEIEEFRTSTFVNSRAFRIRVCYKCWF